jgi:membrane fusion protein (multidrug efflux system)
LVIGLCLSFGSATAATGVIVSLARTTQFANKIEALGTLRANESVELSASITDTVSRIYFDDGDRVAAGTVLVEMTSAEEHALLEEARVTAAEAQRQYERVLSLEKKGTAAVSLLDQRRREWEAAKARLGAIESRLADRIIKAPFAGVLGLRHVSLGALVEPGDVITTLDDDSRMNLEFGVPSIFISALQPDLPVVATTPAFGGREFRGEVKAVDSRIDPVTRSIMVRAILPNPDRVLKPGLLMRVEISSAVREAITVPEEALLALGDKQFLFIVDETAGNTVVRREVQLGARRPGEAEIVSGLRAGEMVITQGTTRVKPGDEVSILAVDDGTKTLHELIGNTPQ